MDNKPFFGILVSSLLLAVPPLHARKAPSPEQNRTIGRLTQDALQAYSDGQYGKALQDFQSVLKLDPKEPVARKGLRLCRYRIRHQRPFRPRVGQPDAKSVRRFVRKKDWMDAIEDVRWILDRSPLDPDALQAQNEIAAALQKKQFESDDGSADQAAYQGFAHYLNKRYGDAAAAWRKAAELSPRDKEKWSAYADKAEALHQEQVREETLLTERARAKAALDSGNTEAAIDAWKKILAVKPDDVLAKEGLDKASDALHRRNRSQLASLYGEEGAAQFKEGRYVSSLRNWEAVQEIDPDNARAKDYIRRIRSKKAVKKPTPLEAWKAAAAKSAPEPAAVSKPVVPEPAESEETETVSEPASEPREEPAAPASSARYGKAVAMYKKGNYEGALQAFQKILNRDPKDSEAADWVERIKAERSDKADDLYNQGLLAYAQGDTKGAIRQWKAALRIDPENAGSKRALQRAMRE